MGGSRQTASESRVEKGRRGLCRIGSATNRNGIARNRRIGDGKDQSGGFPSVVSIRGNEGNWRAYLTCRGLVLALLIACLLTKADAQEVISSHPPTPSATDSQSQHQTQPTNEHQAGDDTPSGSHETSPLSPTNQSKDKNGIASDAQREGEWYARPDWWVAGFTGALFIATAGLWFFTALLWSATKRAVSEGEKSGTAAIKAANAANAHVKESARAASAMEGVSNAMAQNVAHMSQLMEMQREFWQKQMRAYVSVIVGGATYQEREKNLRFEASPALVNTGLTPAHNVVYEIKSDVLPVPLSDSHDFTLSPQDALGGAVVAPHQNRTMGAVVDQIFFDNEVEDIKAGKGKALCVWGTVHYKDVFGCQRSTNFCQVLTWNPGDRVIGYYHKAHNDSN